jgi:hypothetical protein
MPSKQKVALAFLLAAGFCLTSQNAFSRAVSAYEATGTVSDTRPADLLLAAKQKYPSPAERRCDVADKACQKRCVRLTKGEGPRGLACASDCTKKWEKCRKEAPGPQ